MHVEMICNCSATFEADDDGKNTTVITLWANQFISAHSVCGFMSTVKTDTPEKNRKVDVTTQDREM